MFRRWVNGAPETSFYWRLTKQLKSTYLIKLSDCFVAKSCPTKFPGSQHAILKMTKITSSPDQKVAVENSFKLILFKRPEIVKKLCCDHLKPKNCLFWEHFVKMNQIKLLCSNIGNSYWLFILFCVVGVLHDLK